MTDRELLELAAKAVGLPIIFADEKWPQNPGDMYFWCAVGSAGAAMYQCGPHGLHWNPLEDDGDGARMEATLKIDVIWYATFVFAGCSEEKYADHGGDRQKARRRASVRAAAQMEIAKSQTTGANHD